MKNRSTWVGLGLLLAVGATIVWSLARMSARSVEKGESDSGKIVAASPAPVAIEAPSDEPRTSPSSANAVAPVPPVTVASGKSSAPANERDGKGIRMFGFVTDRSRGPWRPDDLLCPRGSRRPECSTIFLESSDCSTSSLRQKRMASLDEEGRYFISDLSPGWWAISVHVPGYRWWSDNIRLVDGEHDRRFDVTLDPDAVLRVRAEIEADESTTASKSLRDLMGDMDPASPGLRCIVLREPPTTNPAAGASLAIERGMVGATGTKDEPGSDGTWVFRESIVLETPLPIFAALVIGNHVLESRRVDSIEDELLFHLTLTQLRQSLGGIRFRLVDDQGQPARPQICRLTREAGLDPSLTAGSIAELTPQEISTSTPGEVRLSGMHPGPLSLRVSVRGCARVQMDTVVEPGVERDLGEVRLERSLPIRGNVLNPDGSPADADVDCVPVREGTSLPPLSLTGDCHTDSRGHFVIDDAGRGSYFIRAHGHATSRPRSMPMRVSTESGSVEGIEVRLLETVGVMVLLKDPSPPGVVVRIDDPEGLGVAIGPTGFLGRGVYATFALPRGVYSAHALANGKQIASKEFTASFDPTQVVLAPH